jgi:hypothetical protein
MQLLCEELEERRRAIHPDPQQFQENIRQIEALERHLLVAMPRFILELVRKSGDTQPSAE